MSARAALALCLSLVAPLPLMAQDAPPQDVAERGYFTGCDAEGEPIYCYIGAAGYSFAVAEDGANAAGLFDQLSGLPMMAAVQFAGSFTDMGDSSADLTLTSLTPVADDPYSATLNALQGDWQPAGEETPLQISVSGLDWLEYQNGEMSDSFQITPGHACADGKAVEGITLSLYRYGDDPAEDACWQVKSFDDGHLVLQDLKGAQGTVSFTRVLDDEGSVDPDGGETTAP